MNNKLLYVLILLILIYLGLTFATPVDTATLTRYHISELSLRLLGLSVSIPLIAIWITAYLGFIPFKKYAESIRDSADGKALSVVVHGLMIMSFGLPIASIISGLMMLGVREIHLDQSVATIITNYVNILIALSGYWFVMKGAQLLKNIEENKNSYAKNTWVVWVLFSIVSLAYIVFTFQNPIRTFSPDPNIRATYYLPDIMIFLTIVVPYIVSWYMGVVAVIHIFHYKQNVSGIIYRQALQYLTFGFLAIIVSSIFLQFFTDVSYSLQTLSLAALLGIVYILLLVIAIGYILIAIGAKKLAKIEEVT